MSEFRNLRDVCINFKESLENDYTQLFCARFGQSYHNEIANKMQDLSMFSAKLRLLEAKSISMGPDGPQPISEEATMVGYEEAAMWKVVEQKTVTSISQFHDVQRLITTPDNKLKPEQIERKEEIITKLKEFRVKEEALRAAEAMQNTLQEEHSVLQSQWDQELGELRDKSDQATTEEMVQEGPSQLGPLYNKLRSRIQKMDLMRWVISRLVTARSKYDWLSDPDRRLQALKMARQSHTVHSYIS